MDIGERDTSTTPEQRDRIWTAAQDRGAPPTADEALLLVQDAELAGYLLGVIGAVSDALETVGYRLIDVTTDDDAGPVCEVWTDAATDSET